MKTLLYKEFRLASHPTTFLFPLLSAMLLIPNYPYYVVFFYTTLGIFFVCLSGRENHDIFYTMLLPVEKRSLVRARMLFAVCMEAVQLVLAVPFAVLRTHFAMPGNAAGMDLPANVAPFILRGVSLVGVDSVRIPTARREEIWNRLADSVDRHRLAAMTRVIGLPDAIDAARRIVDGGIAGRTVVAVSDL